MEPLTLFHYREQLVWLSETILGVFGLPARSRWHPHIANVLAAEAMACRDGVKLAAQSGFSKVVIETDSKSIFIFALFGAPPIWRPHPCPKQSLQSSQWYTWRNQTPGFLCNYLLHDCTQCFPRLPPRH